MKGFYTQCLCILTDGNITIEDIKTACQSHGFQVVKQISSNENWCLGGPTIIISYDPEQNGYISIDVVNREWPDSMGDSKSDLILFGAWSTGNFGPFTYPNGLTRAQQHSWSWEDAKNVSSCHKGFIRIRLSYIFGCEKNAPIMPKNYNALSELNFLNTIVLAVMTIPGAICYFNPNGEVLLNFESFQKTFSLCKEQNNIPLSLWMNIRFFKLTDKLFFMDTVGNRQLDVKDIEAIFSIDDYDGGTVAYYIRNVTHYLIESKAQIKHNDAIDGPNETNLSWMINISEEGTLSPPREVLRVFPKLNRDEVLKAIVKNQNNDSDNSST
ncbi:MAG: DUF4261 domain-containing protein [Ignavibacteriales bacterium]|nr:DUF4261 domain-containing protein [Ignavibacteriales bacterium]